MRPFDGAGMPCLCAGGGFEGAMPRYRAHIEMIEKSVFHWIILRRTCGLPFRVTLAAWRAEDSPVDQISAPSVDCISSASMAAFIKSST